MYALKPKYYVDMLNHIAYQENIDIKVLQYVSIENLFVNKVAKQ